jgi:aryl-alcohol dehydrogenase-like predicted oxidoreductase
LTPVEEVLRTLDDLVRAGKLRAIGCSNFSGWHLMKSLAVADRYGWARYVAHQVYYSLVGRDYEWELMPLALDQKIGTVLNTVSSASAQLQSTASGMSTSRRSWASSGPVE